MSNTELVKYYLGLNKPLTFMKEVPYTDIIKALDDHFNHKWTWELVDERFAMDNSTVCTTVMVYVPGGIFTGRSLCKIKDYGYNHLFAILDACQSFIIKGQQTEQPIQQTQSGMMTPDQIQAAIQQQQQVNPPQVDSAAQFYNYKDEQNIPADSVPMDQMTTNAHNELAAEMGFPQTPVEQNSQSIPQSQQNSDYDAPQERLKGFSQHQVDRLNKFKKDFEILNDSMFDNYVNTWDKNLRSKKDITPQNVELFLSWAEKLMGNMTC